MENHSSPGKSLPPGKRAEYIDAFRGCVMVSMLIGTFGLAKLAEHPLWGFFYGQLRHADWRGFHFEDIILPWFLFIIGLAMSFSYEKRQKLGQSYGQILSHVIKRTIILFALGFIISWARVGKPYFGAGVLQILAICYFGSFLVLGKSIKIQIVAFASLLFIYWFFIFIIPIPEIERNSYILYKNLVYYLDETIIGTATRWGYLYTLITSTAVVIFGSIIGKVLVKPPPHRKIMTLLLILGAGGIITGLVLNPVIPIIKRMFTSSYTLFACGWICLLLLGFYWLIEVRDYRRWSFVFKVIGMNSIFIYTVHLLLEGWMRQTLSVFIAPFGSILGVGRESLTAFFLLIAEFLLCLWLYRRKIFLRI
ncbi:MAG TPA: hypothetical protein ENH82_09865 [bacterium]|nr:hypothetical protein [bacterium]